MALTPETEAEILRRHHADHWPVGAIATQLNLHRDSVARPSPAPTDGLRRGTVLVAPDLPALLPRRPHGEFPARPCRCFLRRPPFQGYRRPQCAGGDLDTGGARARRCPEDESLTVGEAFTQERERLLALPDDTFPTDEVRVVSVGTTPYVRFEPTPVAVPLPEHVKRQNVPVRPHALDDYQSPDGE